MMISVNEQWLDSVLFGIDSNSPIEDYQKAWEVYVKLGEDLAKETRGAANKRIAEIRLESEETAKKHDVDAKDLLYVMLCGIDNPLIKADFWPDYYSAGNGGWGIDRQGDWKYLADWESSSADWESSSAYC